jgi:hypothetical protein
MRFRTLCAMTLLCAGAVACRRAPQPQNQGILAPLPASLPKNVVLGNIDACTYFTAEDAEAVVGAPVQTAKVTHETLAETHSSRCAYLTSKAPIKVVNLFLQQLPNREQAAKAFEFARDHAATVAGVEPRTIPNLGEKAFWVGGSANKLQVLRGNLWMTFGAAMGPGLDQAGPAQAAAEKSMRHF